MQTKLLNVRKLFIAGMFLLTANSGLFAQTSDQRTNLQLYGSALQYRGELNDNKEYSDPEWGGGINLNRYISPSFDAGLHLTYNRPEVKSETLGYFEAKMATAMLAVRLKMYGTILNEDALIGPYLQIAGGGTWVDTDAVRIDGSKQMDDKYFTTAARAGAGIRFRFSDAVSAFVETNYMINGQDKIDGYDVGDNDRFLMHNVGIGFNLGKAKDTDGDGVPDRKDKCPNTPAGVQVDANGCPIDTDGDGIADYLDECPSEAGTAATKGCPDRDGDGIIDKRDECPDQPGTLAMLGCPDTDGDGVADGKDKCPGTPAGVIVGPDGCPLDTDGDGIPNYKDACPTTPGPGTTNGCPVVDVETLNLIKKKVFFEFDKARVDPSYMQLLDSIVTALKMFPDHELIIKGHADYVGSEEYNQALSEARAANVKEHLLKLGVKNPNRLITKGYGESRPLVPVNENLPMRKTEVKRALNRRVGFELNTPYLKLNLE